jgi:uncharacterized protein (TIGR03086 family)
MTDTITAQTPILNSIDRAIAAAGVILGRVRDTDWSRPTPCAPWDVREVANHLVGGMVIYAAELRGEAHGDHEQDWLGADPQAAFAEAAVADATAWRADGAFDRTIALAFGPTPAPFAAIVHLTELVAHGADIAVATRQEHLVDTDGSEEVLRLMTEMGIDAFRVPGIFGPEVAIAADAPIHRRLLSYLGRNV